MRNTRQIVKSSYEPDVENLWLHDGRLKFFGPNGWTLINGAFDATPLYDAVNTNKGKVSESFKEDLIEALNEGRITYMYDKDKKGYLFKVLVGFATLDPKSNNLFLDVINYDGRFRFNLDLNTNEVSLETSPNTASEGGSSDEMVAFKLSENAEDNRLNLQLAADFLFNRVEAVFITGERNGVSYNTIGVYHDGFITALQKNHYIVFNVSFDSGYISIESDTSVDKMLPQVILKKGDTNEIMQYNTEHLPNGEFFLHLEYGYGVGTFQDGQGGFAHITTAYGNEAFYTISPDGAILPDRDYIKPNEPYTVILDNSNIGTPLDDVLASRVSKAGEIIINGSTGPITYTRAADSTPNTIYFTDSRKDGKMTVLSYSISTKTIIASINSGDAVADATNDTIVSTINSLLSSLRRAGVINAQ